MALPACADAGEAVKQLAAGIVQAKITTLGLRGDAEARYLLRRALRDSEPAAQRFGWRLLSLYELPADDDDVGYTQKDGSIFIKVRNPTAREGVPALCYDYSFVLATLLHELVHLSHLGHGKVFYRCLSAALSSCGADAKVRREARAHVCAELLNAVCDNDARRARALLAAMPEAANCRRPGAESSQLPLEYAAHHGRVALTRLLLEARADPALCSAAGNSGVAPLARAAANGNAKTAALLLAARANVADVPEARGQSVLDKAIAAAEVGGFMGKAGEWWKVPKLLSDDHRRRDADAPPSSAAPSRRSRSTAARGSSRRRRHRTSCSEGGSADSTADSSLGAAKRALSLPVLPAVASLPALPGREVRRPMVLSRLAGSLAL